MKHVSKIELEIFLARLWQCFKLGCQALVKAEPTSISLVWSTSASVERWRPGSTSLLPRLPVPPKRERENVEAEKVNLENFFVVSATFVRL